MQTTDPQAGGKATSANEDRRRARWVPCVKVGQAWLRVHPPPVMPPPKSADIGALQCSLLFLLGGFSKHLPHTVLLALPSQWDIISLFSDSLGWL